ncbi:MAG: Crp/Fnr family transcriptional regulator [Deltaproteobacteria bacterium]|jgi:CRP/FNR family transcriptional regulator|nr:Crp/Fnr family transcriptional regulator [Deltaproteobacteria bacterium]
MNLENDFSNLPEDGIDRRIRVMELSPIFGNLPRELLIELAEVGEICHYPRGELIFQQGDSAEGFYLVSSGLVKIYQADPDGDGRVLHLCGPGTIFGAAAVLSDEGYPATAEAERTSVALFLPNKGIKDLMVKYPDLALALFEVVAQKLIGFKELLKNYPKNLARRVAQYLRGLPIDPDESTISIPIKLGTLANHLGMAPENLSRVLTKLKENKALIPRGKNREFMVDMKRLNLIADGKERL